MGWYPLTLDKEINAATFNLEPGCVKKLSPPEAQVDIYAVGADENLFIAQETKALIDVQSRTVRPSL